MVTLFQGRLIKRLGIAQVFVEYGVVTWPDEIDLAPDAIYERIKQYGKWVLH
ncbi:DUF2442 domain-containing protein [Geobacter pickeringii]|uniref:DUF2442 domain-containing protein n=1 Tax=Geobacter pickeringii TaxID=345632 RepID=UPI002E8246A1|nr:DUF2442 domain-containing protein [Geobacter pickeringii]